MPAQKKQKRRIFRRLLSLLLLAVLAFAGWNYLRPLLSDETITTYDSYVAFRGDIETFNSYSATLDVLYSETISNGRQVTSVKKVYVQANQEVSEGDKLMQLESGDVLKAGINGTVNEIRFGEGEWIWPNVSLIQICDLTNLQVSLSVDEYDISNVNVGEKCYVTIVPLGLQFETEVAHVDRVSGGSSSVAYYSVTAELTVPENVLPGMTASVSIPADGAADTLLLEMAALSFDEDSAPYVLIPKGETYEKRPVEIGLSDGMNVQVLSGISEGETVYRVSGEEKAVSSISLSELYQKLAGQKVVIRDNTGSDRGGMRMPGMMGNSDSMTLPEGMTAPEGFEMPEGMTMPEGFEMPEGMTMPEGFEMPEGMTAPEGFEMPEGMTAPEGMRSPEQGEAPDASETPESEKKDDSEEKPENRPPDGREREAAPSGDRGSGAPPAFEPPAFSQDEESARSNHP